jgi:signal transduction histidine kinase/ligand-binding sensor domain-containing protein/DNA-binding response OmpR family regulator
MPTSMSSLCHMHRIALLLIYMATTSYSQQDVRFKRISTDNGLSESLVHCITQDRYGFMWFGTNNGANRYDGYEMIVYQNNSQDSSSLSSNFISSFYSDSQGNFWVATSDGVLHLYNSLSGTFTRFTLAPDLVSNVNYEYHHCIFEDHLGRLWSCSINGLAIFDWSAKKLRPFAFMKTIRDSLGSLEITAVYQDLFHQLWLGTLDHGLVILNPDDGTFRHYQYRDSQHDKISHNRVESIIADSSGLIWVATYGGGIDLYDIKQNHIGRFQHQPHREAGLSDDFIFSMYVDAKKNIWIGTENGLNRSVGSAELREGTTFIHYHHDKNDPHSLSSDNIRCIYEDRQGNLWIGTYKGGVNFYARRDKRFYHYYSEPNNPRSLSHNIIHCIYNDRQDNIWICTNGGGLCLFDKKKHSFITYQNKDGQNNSISNNNVTSIVQDHTGLLWIGTWFGLNTFDPAHTVFQRFYHNPLDSTSLGSDHIFYIMEDSRACMWICTYDGLCMWDRRRGTFRHFSHDPDRPGSICHNWISSNILEDRQGDMWVGTVMGLNRLKRSDIERDVFCFDHFFTPQNPGKSIKSMNISCIEQNERGELWLGTSDGLFLFNPATDSIAHFTTLQGLPSNTIISILQDLDKNLWLGTMKGLCKFDPVTLSTTNYDMNDGLQNNEFHRAATRDHSGWMYFGGINGFNLFHPDSIRNNPDPPPVVITSFQIFNRPVSLADFINKDNEIELSYQQNIFSFEFAALDFTNPPKNRYAYMLEGFNKDWIFTDAKRRIATYTNLQGGHYTFRVKASNNDGVWNDQGAAVHIVVNPPFWKTNWALLLYIAMTLLILFGLRTIVAVKERYDADLRLDRLKLDFFTKISHEFRTPLTLILGPLEKMIHSGKNLSWTKRLHYYQLIHRNSQRLLRLINQLMDVRKLDAGSMKPLTEQGDLVLFVKSIFDSFTYQAEKRAMRFSFNSQPSSIMMSFDPEMMDKIVYNVLSNAFKYTPDGGEISLSLTCLTRQEFYEKFRESESLTFVERRHMKKVQADSVAEIVVRDNGAGIDKNHIQHIFDLFYQGENPASYGQSGTGIGLALTRDLVRLHNGEIAVTSELGKGAQFFIWLPVTECRHSETEAKEMATAAIEPALAWTEYDDETVSREEKVPAESALPLILLVEDDRDLRIFIRDELDENYRVQEAADGIQGYQLAVETVPDLIISDIVMPGLDGTDLCRKLKSDERTSHIPIILLTAKTNEAARLEGFQTGADDYITKPFNADLLRIRAGNLIESRQKLRSRFSREIHLQPADIAITPYDEVFLNKAVQAVEENMSDPDFSVEQMSYRIGMSRSQLYRKLFALTGQSPRDFVRILRLKRAANLIAQAQITIAEAAFRVGFDDPAYFSKCFRKQFGVAPGEYKGHLL